MNIGLTQRILHYNNIAYDCLEHGWYQLLDSHTPLPIANNEEQNFQQLVDKLDLIIFTGGDASPRRLLTETRLLTECYKQNKPVLGVCHGAFFINQMEQGVNAECEGHYNTEHSIQMLGTEYQVNSYHNNKIVSVGSDYNIVATTDQNDIEAFKHKSRPIWGIVWHPERMEKPVLPKQIESFLYG
jgi:N5-(cytidine 5'-diphosphoramidyl)-L-glutamine hydrolase